MHQREVLPLLHGVRRSIHYRVSGLVQRNLSNEGKTIMKRRGFIEAAVASAGLLLVPSTALALIPPGARVTRFRVGILGEKLDPVTRGAFPRPPDSEYNYEVAVIASGGRFFYAAKGRMIEITESHAYTVIRYPRMHYFTTALKLDRKLGRAPAGVVVPL